MNRANKRWLAVFVWMAVIFVMSTDVGSGAHSSALLEPIVLWVNPNTSPEQFEFVHFLFRKAGHVTEYAVLGILILRAVRSSPRPSGAFSISASILVTLLIASAFASTDEFHQVFVAGRGPSLIDVLIDTCGAALGVGLSLARGALANTAAD